MMPVALVKPQGLAKRSVLPVQCQANGEGGLKSRSQPMSSAGKHAAHLQTGASEGCDLCAFSPSGGEELVTILFKRVFLLCEYTYIFL